MADFIEVYPEVLTQSQCAAIIAQFDQSGQASRSRVGSGTETRLKDHYDLTITGKSEWRETAQLLQSIVFDCLREYIKKYRYALIGPLALRYRDPKSGEITLINDKEFIGLDDEALAQLLARSFRTGSICLQKFLADQGRPQDWRSDLYPHDAACEALHRVLLWILYLNAVPAGGETEFIYQRRKVSTAPGSLVLAPAGFTHTHRDRRPKGGHKYISTSWILFQKAERLYPRA